MTNNDVGDRDENYNRKKRQEFQNLVLFNLAEE